MPEVSHVAPEKTVKFKGSDDPGFLLGPGKVTFEGKTFAVENLREPR